MKRDHKSTNAELPDGYQRAQYIQFPNDDKHLGLDTGVMPQMGLKLNCKVVFQQRTVEPNRNFPCLIFGFWYPNANYRFILFSTKDKFVDGKYVTNQGLYENATQDKTIDFDTELEIESYIDDGNQYLLINGESYPSTTSVQFTGTPPNWDRTLLFGQQVIDDNNSAIRGFYGKVMYMQLSKNGILLADWLPCKRISDDKYGMWDFVSNEFKTANYITGL